MRLRFLETRPSDHPDFPFQPGQIIPVIELTEAMRAWVTEGAAVILPDSDEDAAALEPPSETATLSRPRKRGPR